AGRRAPPRGVRRDRTRSRRRTRFRWAARPARPAPRPSRERARSVPRRNTTAPAADPPPPTTGVADEGDLWARAVRGAALRARCLAPCVTLPAAGWHDSNRY